MSDAANVAYYFGYLLLLLTAISSARAAWRYRDAHHFIILGFVISHVLLPRSQTFRPLHVAVLFAQPYLLLRLVEQFRDVPRVSRLVVVGGIAAAILASVVEPELNLASASPSRLYFFVVNAYVAVAFLQEARRKAGVTAKRLTFAALGTWLFASVFLVYLSANWMPSVGRLAAHIGQLLIAGGLTCYFFAFSTPRRLRSAWQRTEQAKYLTGIAELDPVERGRRAADDLKFAGSRSVGNAVTLVALRDRPTGHELTVHSSTDPTLVGLRVRPASGVFGRVSRDVDVDLGSDDQL